MTHRTRWLLASGLALSMSVGPFVACSDSGAIVGGRCADGLTACAGQCVRIQSDPSHCGACGVVCGPGVDCLDGRCGGWGDAGPDGQDADQSVPADADAGEGDVAWLDGADSDGAQEPGQDTPDGTQGECGASPCDDADATGDEPGVETGGDAPDGEQDGSTCVPPYDTAANCGACGQVCQGATPVCGPAGDGGFACAPLCDPPLVDCGGACKDLQTDEQNCGACNNKCITGLCFDGLCVGGGVGHVVLIGMDFHVWYPGAPPTRVFGNSVFLPPHNPLRVLTYTQHGDDSSGGAIAAVANLTAWYSAQIGRPYVLTDIGAANGLPALLNPAEQDVLLILDQPKAPPGELASIGASWSQPVSDYVHAGGTVVVLMSAQGQNEMPQLVTSSGLGSLDAVHDITVPSHILANVAPWDAIGINVMSPFLARPETVTLQTSMVPGADTIFVVVDNTNPDAGAKLPVVIHRVVVP
ncbi:MAG: hypothetical protein HY898_14120 [Deltaproteobacteria bacterium]|nr:hypothetical protein [Deltaproteobacteria bacterium]